MLPVARALSTRSRTRPWRESGLRVVAVTGRASGVYLPPYYGSWPTPPLKKATGVFVLRKNMAKPGSAETKSLCKSGA